MTESWLRRLIILSFAGIILIIGLYNLWAYQGTVLVPALKNAVTENPHLPLSSILKQKGISSPIPDIWLELVKSRHALTVYSGKAPLKTYRVALSKDYLADKVKAGDSRTPVGEYRITEKKSFSPPKRFLGKSQLQLNYPNDLDAVRGLRQGIITGKDFLAIHEAAKKQVSPPQDTPLGGGISIHGGGGPLLGGWPEGSVCLYEKDMAELMPVIEVGTKVIIRK